MPTARENPAPAKKRQPPQMKGESKLPWRKQRQRAPGLESQLDPQPRFKAPRYKAAGKIKNKIALITGGDSGIGRAVALLYAREGAEVAISTHLGVFSGRCRFVIHHRHRAAGDGQRNDRRPADVETLGHWLKR